MSNIGSGDTKASWGNITGTIGSQSDLQTSFSAKQNTLTGLTASVAELNHLVGATSAIQTQLDAKGVGNALTTNPLSQFAATTSAQLLGVISDETGTGSLVFSVSPTFTGTPVLPSGTTVGGLGIGLKNQEIAAYGAGTAYTLTNTAAAVDLGTTDPAIVLNVAGTYLILAQIDLAYNGATVIAETATVKVRRTNNTAADLSVVVVLDLPVATTLTNTYGTVFIPPFVYTTAVTDDAITIFANVSAALSAGSIDATAIGTSILAIRLY